MSRLQVNSSALRSSCRPSARSRFAGSCFSIDFFALQPTSRTRDRLSFQLQTTYACACSNTHTHLDCSQLLQYVTHLGGQMFPCLVQREEKFYSGTPKWRSRLDEHICSSTGKWERTEKWRVGCTVLMSSLPWLSCRTTEPITDCKREMSCCAVCSLIRSFLSYSTQPTFLHIHNRHLT